MISDYRLEAFSRPVSDLADTPLLGAGELKAHFDSNSYELLDALNGVIEALSGENSLAELKLSGEPADKIISDINEMLALKADSVSVEESREKINAELAGKAERDEVEALQSEKADKSELAEKVDKEEGKGLSSNDFTDEYRIKVDAVNSSVNAKAELIETITVTEEGISEIIRNTEPDGAAYNFKALTVYQEIKPCEVSNYVVMSVYDNESASGETLASYQAQNSVTVAGRLTKAHYDVIGGTWIALGGATTMLGVSDTLESSPASVTQWRFVKPYTGQRIKSLKLKGHTTSLEVGTVFYIYGVRA